MKNTQKPAYGGQAVIEGVMFGGKHHTVTAIRRKDSSIDFFHLPRKTRPVLQKLKKIPFLRGLMGLSRLAQMVLSILLIPLIESMWILQMMKRLKRKKYLKQQ